MALKSAIKIIAAIEDENYLQKIASNINGLEGANMVAASKYSTEIIELCRNLSPDVLISDLSLDNGNMTDTIKKVCRNSSKKITVIATSSRKEGEAWISQSLQNGASFYMNHLDDPEILRNSLHIANSKHLISENQYSEEHCQPTRSELTRTISEILHKLKLPTHFPGYYYLKNAILHTTLRDNKLPDISRQLYIKISEEFDTNAKHVERAIARAVTYMTNNSGKENILRIILDYDVDAANYTLTAKEFIALVSDQLRIKYLDG